MRFFPRRLGPKLNVSLLVFFLLLGSATSVLVFFGFQRTQDNATDLSQQGLELQGSQTLERLADQTSFSGQLIVAQATQDASAAASYLARAHQLGATVPWDASRLAPAPTGALIDPSSTRTTDVWVPSSLEMTDQLRTNLTDSATLDVLFPTLLRGNPDAVAIYYVTPQGAVRQYPPYGVNDDLPPEFDFFTQTGFEEFRSGATAPTVARWTAPYESPAVSGLTITALAPVYEDGIYRGVIGVDVAVPRLIARVDEVRYTPGGYAFVVDRNGQIVPSRHSNDVRALLDDPDQTQFGATVQAMRAGKMGFERVDIGDEDVIVAYAPLGDLGGSLALVSPVDELTAQAAAVTSEIDEQGDRTMAFILATMLGFFIAGLLAAAWFNRRLLTAPVESMVRGTQAVASGNYNVRMPIGSTDELGMLADSFNIMIEQIDLGQQRLEQRNRELQAQIAERTRVEEELRRSEDLYRTLARNFPNGTVVLYDRELRFQIVDGQGMRSLGLEQEDIQGKRLDELFTPRVRDLLRAPMEVVFDGETRVFEIEAQNRVLIAYTLPLFDERGEIFAGMAMTQDITERKRAEAELAEREAQYRSIFESVSDGLIITDLEGGVVEVNPAFAAMHGYSREEMLTTHPMSFIHADSHHLFVEYSETIAAGGIYRCRATDVRKDGSTFPVEVMGRPVMYGGSQHVLGVVRDITEQVVTERLLEQRVEERTREIAALLDISHAVTSTLELKTLVAVILQQLGQVVEHNAASVLLREGGDLAIMEFDEEIMGRPSTGAGLHFSLAAADAIWQQALKRQPAIIENVYDDSELAASFRDAVGPHLHTTYAHVRAALFVPLALQDDVIGLVAISHGTPGYFTEHNAALVMAVANHAAVAIENARLFERVEQRTRELSTLLELSHSVTSTLSLNQLVPVILESLQAVIAYMGASILLRDGDELAIVTYDPSIDTTAPRQSPLRFGLDESLPLWQNMLRHEPAVIDDVHDESPLARSFRQTVGQNIIDATFDLVNAVLVVPLASQGVVIGVVALTHVEKGFFRQSDASLAMTVANQAAVAIQNARLFESVEERTRELTTLLDVSHDVTSTLELDPLLNLLLDEVRLVADYDRASVLLLEGEELVVAAFKEIGAVEEGYGYPLGTRFPFDGESIGAQRLKSGRPLLIADVQSDEPAAVAYRESIGATPERLDYHGWMGVPLVHQDRLIGALVLGKRAAGYYTERQGKLATAIANQAAVAVENARLFQSTEERTRELTTLLDVSHDVTSTLDLDPLLSLILDQVRIVADYDRASVMLVEGEQLVVSAVKTINAGLEHLGSEVGTRFPLAASDAALQRLRRGRPTIIEDIKADTPEARAYRATVEPMTSVDDLEFRSWMGVPLVQQERVVGLLTLAKRTPGYYTERQSKLAAAIANQAAVAVENARLFQSTEARTRELSTLLDVSHAVASTLDLPSLVRIILEQARAVLDYQRSSVTLVDGENLAVFAVLNADGNETESYLPPGTTFSQARAGVIWNTLRTGKHVIIDDITDDSSVSVAYRRLIPVNLDEPDFHSWLAVPLSSQDAVLGLLSFTHPERGHYTERDAQLATAIANQAAVAIENARLFDSVQRRTRELSALLDVSHSVAATLDLRVLVSLILDQLKLVSDYTGSSLLRLEGDNLVILDSRGPGGREEEIIGIGFPVASVPQWWERFSVGRPVIIDDVKDDSDEARAYRAAIGARINDPEFSFVRSWLAVPLMLQDRPVGMLSVSRDEPAYFNSDHVRIARAVADQAAIAIENARLYQQAQQFAAVEERQRLARELHDSVSQALYGIALGARTARTLLDRDPAKAVEPVEYVLQLAEAGLTEMRALIFELRPESLENEGLVVAIEKQVAATRARYGLDVEDVLCEEPPAPIEIKEAIFRVVQESLHNIVKHAHASHIAVRLECTDAEITLDVSDDGVGFDAGGSFPGHMGLKSMRERTVKFGGETTIESAPGEGTRIKVRIPLGGAGSARQATTTTA